MVKVQKAPRSNWRKQGPTSIGPWGFCLRGCLGLQNSSTACLGDKSRMLINTTRIFPWCPDHKCSAFLEASQSLL